MARASLALASPPRATPFSSLGGRRTINNKPRGPEKRVAPQGRPVAGASRRHTAACVSLVRLGAGRLDHLGPLLRFLYEEPAKLGGRAREHRAAGVGKPRLH